MSEEKEENSEVKLVEDFEKNEKLEKEKQELLNKVLSGNISNKRERVGYLLNNIGETRNSDIELVWNYWTTFESKFFNGSFVSKREMFMLTAPNSIIRERARIQNEYKLFQATENVKRNRRRLEEEKRNEAFEEKPTNLPLYSIFIDESGKTQEFLSVGSLWNMGGGLSTYKTTQTLNEWKTSQNIEFEFHFKEVKKHRLQHFKDFFQKFLSLNSTIGFKLITVRNNGFQDLSSAITDLTFHLINKGIEHENNSGRAPLPRILQVWIDDEEKGSDLLKLENIKERINSQKIDGLFPQDFQAVDSKSNYYIQAVDLFTASVNRKIHSTAGENNVKDELASFILDLLRFDINKVDRSSINIDNTTVFNLNHNVGVETS